MFCCIHRTATAYCCAAAACTLVTHAAVRVCLGLSAINPIPLTAAAGLVLQGGKRADAHMPCSSSRSRLPQLAAATPSSSRMVLWHLVWNSAMHTCLPPDQASRPAKHWSNLPATWKHIPARRRQLSLHLYWINMDFYDYYELLDLHKVRRCKSFSF